jgi:hypothetical protein
MSSGLSPPFFPCAGPSPGAWASAFREDAPGAWSLFGAWVTYVLGARTRGFILMRWVRCPEAGQVLLVASLLAKRQPPTPLVWRAVEAASLEEARPRVEAWVLERLRELVPPSLKAVVLGDEDFSAPRFLRKLRTLRLEHVIRVDPDTAVFHDTEGCRPAAAWTPASQRPGRVRHVRLTRERVPVAALVCVKKGHQPEPWCLATSLGSATAKAVVDAALRLEGAVSPPAVAFVRPVGGATGPGVPPPAL